MKKLLSIMLALVLILSMATVAFADENDTTVTYKATEEKEFTEIVKTYTSENNVVVNETLSFTSTASTSNPDGGAANLTVADLTINATNFNVTEEKDGNKIPYLNVTIPSLNKAGTYEWTIKEKKGNTAGVTYSTDEVHVIVLVEYDNEKNELKIANTTSYIKKDNGNKAKTFTNTFKSGSFTVEKDIYGNMANKNDDFEVTVTLTSTKPIGTTIKVAGSVVTKDQWISVKNDKEEITGYTYTTTMELAKATGAKAFADIPTDVVVTVSETETDMKGYTLDDIYQGEIQWDEDGTRIVTAKFDDDNGLKIADDTNAKIVVVNYKKSNVETGIALDSMPYFLMLAVACMGLVVFFMKKRNAREY